MHLLSYGYHHIVDEQEQGISAHFSWETYGYESTGSYRRDSAWK